MIDITRPISKKEIDEEFLRKMFILARTYGNTGNYTEVKDFVDYAFKIGGIISPTDLEYEPFET